MSIRESWTSPASYKCYMSINKWEHWRATVPQFDIKLNVVSSLRSRNSSAQKNVLSWDKRASLFCDFCNYFFLSSLKWQSVGKLSLSGFMQLDTGNLRSCPLDSRAALLLVCKQKNKHKTGFLCVWFCANFNISLLKEFYKTFDSSCMSLSGNSNITHLPAPLSNTAMSSEQDRAFSGILACLKHPRRSKDWVWESISQNCRLNLFYIYLDYPPGVSWWLNYLLWTSLSIAGRVNPSPISKIDF